MNVVLILADDLGYGDVGCFGNPLVRTPYLDRLAAEGVVLRQHYSASPICAPARAALLTGRYNHRTGAVDVPSNRGLDRIHLRERTIADLLKGAGFATGMVGKWHNGLHDTRYHPNRRGFDEFAGFLNGGMDYWQWVLDRNGVPQRSDGRYLTDVFTDEAVAFLERHYGEPFCLYVAYNAPHSPFQAPEDVLARYTGRDLTRNVATIYAMVERMDAGIGRILETLDATGLRDDTLVLFSSDNGPYLGGGCMRPNGLWSGGKYDALEGGIRVPAILRWPNGLPAGMVCDEMVHFVDWLPTLLGMAGVDVPRTLGLDGCDMYPALRGEPHAVPRVRFWQWNRYEPVRYCNAAMRDGPWKLYWPPVPEARAKVGSDNAPYRRGLTHAHWLMDVDGSLPGRTLSDPRAPRLFDLASDPQERVDLSKQHPDRVARMTRAWDHWFDEVTAAWRRAHAENTRPHPQGGEPNR